MKHLFFACVVAFTLVGCESETEKTSEAAEASQAAEAQLESVSEELAEAAKFDKGMRKKSCDILTPTMVANAFDVPVAELKQIKIMGCTYTWSKDGEELMARFGSIRVHKNVGVAKRWHKNATKGMTAEETRKAMAEITKEAKKDERIDTETKKKAADTMGGVLGEMGEFRFGDVEGIGDEARENLDDGELWVRVGNMTFIVSAYKGPPQPPTKLRMEKNKLKEFTRKVTAEQKEWTRKTLPQRQQAARTVATMVIDKL